MMELNLCLRGPDQRLACFDAKIKIELEVPPSIALEDPVGHVRSRIH
jgi:hypothetical protein